GIPLFNDLIESSVGKNLVRHQQTPRKRIHSPDMRVEQVQRVARTAPALGVEIKATPADPALLLQDHHHRRGRGTQIGRELIRSPATNLPRWRRRCPACFRPRPPSVHAQKYVPPASRGLLPR